MRGVAALAACIVESMRDIDPTFQTRFLDNLDKAYLIFRDNTDGDTIRELSLLSACRSYLTGFNFVDGQGKPLLRD
jgi:hypothetical protein